MLLIGGQGPVACRQGTHAAGGLLQRAAAGRGAGSGGGGLSGAVCQHRAIGPCGLITGIVQNCRQAQAHRKREGGGRGLCPPPQLSTPWTCSTALLVSHKAHRGGRAGRPASQAPTSRPLFPRDAWRAVSSSWFFDSHDQLNWTESDLQSQQDARTNSLGLPPLRTLVRQSRTHPAPILPCNPSRMQHDDHRFKLDACPQSWWSRRSCPAAAAHGAPQRQRRAPPASEAQP